MLIPSIGFQGNCDEAINYYKEVLGAEVKTINHFKDAPEDHGMEESLPPNFVMYSEVVLFGTTMVMADGMKRPMKGEEENFWFTLSFDCPKETTSVFNKLADGGRVIEALAPQFWVSLSGDVVDRFGICWNVSAI